MIGFMFIVAILFFFSCQDDSVAVNQPDVLKPSDIPGYEKYYKPSEFAMMDMFSRDAKWSFYRHKQSEHFIVFWEVGFGKDPNAKSVSESMRVDVDDLLAKAEQFYLTNIETLKFAEVGQGKSYLDRYKMQIYLLYQEEWLATGSGYDDVIGALWINPSTCKPVGSTIAHEIGHSFQYQVYCDKLLNGAAKDFHQGFRYGFGPNGEGGNGFCNLFRLILKNFLGIMLMFGKLTITVILITNGCDMPVTGYLITGHRNMVLVYWEKYGNNRNIRKIRL